MWELEWPVHVSVSSWLYLMCTVFISQLPVFIHPVFPGHRCPTSGCGKCVYVRRVFLHICAMINSRLNCTVNVAWGFVVMLFHCKPIKTSLRCGTLSKLSSFGSRFHVCSFNMISGALCRISKPHVRSFQFQKQKLYWIKCPVLECFLIVPLDKPNIEKTNCSWIPNENVTFNCAHTRMFVILRRLILPVLLSAGLSC